MVSACAAFWNPALPHCGGNEHDIHFDDRRLTLSYARPAPITIGPNNFTYLAQLDVTGSFLGTSTTITVTIKDGE